MASQKKPRSIRFHSRLQQKNATYAGLHLHFFLSVLERSILPSREICLGNRKKRSSSLLRACEDEVLDSILLLHVLSKRISLAHLSSLLSSRRQHCPYMLSLPGKPIVALSASAFLCVTTVGLIWSWTSPSTNQRCRPEWTWRRPPRPVDAAWQRGGGLFGGPFPTIAELTTMKLPDSTDHSDH